MTAVRKKEFISPAEYFTILENSNERYELVDGQIYAMAGGSRKHTRLIRQLSKLLDIHLGHGPCEVLPEFMLRINTDSDNYVYPDLLVECNEHNDVRDFATEPKLIIEVLSPSTSNYDLGKKFDMYTTFDSLQEYVVIEQNIMRVDIFRKSDNWNATRYEKGSDVEFQSIGLTIPIAEIYDRILFTEDITAKEFKLVPGIKDK